MSRWPGPGELGADDAIVVDVNSVVHVNPAALAVYPLPVGSDLRRASDGWWDNRTDQRVEHTR